MRMAILGDIHANLEALQAVLDDIRRNSINEILSVGDVVGYGANPRECLSLLKNAVSYISAGNHDWAVVGRLNLNWFNDNARRAVIWTMSILTTDERDWLNDLPLVQNYRDIILVHGCLYEPERFHYLLDLHLAERNFDYQEAKICFIGHSHIPFFVWLNESDGEIEHCQDIAIQIEKGKKYLINVGSVGQPRDGDPRACYAIYDLKENLVILRRVEYDIEQAQDKIIKAGLPANLANRLSEGR